MWFRLQKSRSSVSVAAGMASGGRNSAVQGCGPTDWCHQSGLLPLRDNSPPGIPFYGSISPPPNAAFFARCTGVRRIRKAAKPPTAALCAPALDDSFRVKGTLNAFTECLCSVQDIFRRLPRTVCAGQPPDNLKRACVQHSGSQALMTAYGSYASGLWGRSRESVTFC